MKKNTGEIENRVEKSTEEIENEMEDAASIEEIIDILKQNNISNRMFGDRLVELCDKYQIELSSIQTKVAISKSQFYAVANGTRNPSKETVLKIAITLELSEAEINELLKLAGHKELYAKNKDDAIIMWGIRSKMKIEEIDQLLQTYNSKIRLSDKR